MTHSDCTKNLLQIKDTHITLEGELLEETLKDRQVYRIQGKLTYKPTACPRCGAVNQSTDDIICHGYLPTNILIGQINFYPIYICLKKQRYLCKHCHKTFTAQTDLVNPYCHISQTIKQMIVFELAESQSMKLIAQHLNVSVNSVLCTLEAVGAAESKYRPTLPTHLAIDEFKSVKQVSGVMSCVIVNNHQHTLFDMLEDRTQATLKHYFMRYSLKERRKVKTVTIDMYGPYYQFFQTLFPEAEIIIDRFHVVQLLNRTLNQLRIRVMNDIKSSRPRDYRKLKQQWKLLLKPADALDFEDYRSHRLYDGLVTEKMMVNYLIQLDPKLEQAYDWTNRVKYALMRHDFKALEHELEESHKYTFSRPLRRSFNTLEKYIKGIENACTYTLSNGYIEGINNKIKLIKRTGYGYRRFDHLKIRVFLSQKLKDRGHPSPRLLTFAEEKEAAKKQKQKLRQAI